MFGFKKKVNKVELTSPVNGKMIHLEEVPDPVFSKKMMGPGVAFISSDGKVHSPCDGELVSVFPTKHAIGIKAENGAEILIHFGLDTVALEGNGFSQKVKTNEKVKRGDLLLEVDIDFLIENGYKIETPMIITNADSFLVNDFYFENVQVNSDVVMSIEKK